MRTGSSDCSPVILGQVTNDAMSQKAFYTKNSNVNPDSYPLVTLTPSSLPLTLRTLLPEDVTILTKLLSGPENTKDDLSVSKQWPAEMESMISEWLTVTPRPSRFNFLVLSVGVPIGISSFV